MNSESDLDNMTEVWPPVPAATREAPAVEPGVGAAGVRKATPQRHRSPLGGPVSVSSAAAATTAVPAVTAVTATAAGTFPRPWGDLRGTWRFSASSLHRKAGARGPSRGA